MASFKEGDVIYMKTSGEPVLVLEIGEQSLMAKRPLDTQDGVQHVTEELGFIEVETPEERTIRAFDERMRHDRLLEKLQRDAKAGITDIEPMVN